METQNQENITTSPNTNPSPVAQAPLPSVSSNEKGKAGIKTPLIILFLFVVILILGYFLAKTYFFTKPSSNVTPTPSAVAPTVQPTIDPTVNWKIFESVGNKYSVKYPPEFFQNECNNKNIDLNLVKTNDCGSNRIPVIQADVLAFPLAPYLENLRKNYSLQESKITIGGKEATRYDGILKDGVQAPDVFQKGIWVFIKRDELGVGAMFEIKYAKISKESKDYSSTFDQILSTFKFTTKSTNEPEISIPVAGEKVASPLTVKGKVPPGWMFEGQFPIRLTDSSKNIIASASAKEVTPGSWTSNTPTDFSASLTFTASSGSGFLILESDNPSGDPSKSKTFEAPIVY